MMTIIVILIVFQVTLIIVIGEIRYKHEKKREEADEKAMEMHVLSPYLPSIIEEEMKKKLK